MKVKADERDNGHGITVKRFPVREYGSGLWIGLTG